jgi:hypothetical protein
MSDRAFRSVLLASLLSIVSMHGALAAEKKIVTAPATSQDSAVTPRPAASVGATPAPAQVAVETATKPAKPAGTQGQAEPANRPDQKVKTKSNIKND